MSETKIDMELEALHTQDKTKGERYYARKFKSSYIKVRKAAVLVRNQRKEIGSQAALAKFRAFLISVVEEME